MVNTQTPTDTQLDLILQFQLKMSGLGIKAKFIRVEDGPVVTAFYYELASHIPVDKILNRSEDFAMAAGVDSIYITRIRSHIVFFVPKPLSERRIVDFKQVAFECYKRRHEFEVPLALGVDHLGTNTIIELTTQPHVLIGGQTNAGKSVFLKNLIANIVICKDITEVMFKFVDTKRLDLPLFDGIPHVLDIARNVKEAHKVFKSLLAECESRYQILESERVTNIREWNKKNPSNKYNYFVLVVDELADLLMQDKEYQDSLEKEEKEALGIQKIPFYLQRLVQISRAAGIHMIAGTQRPSHKVMSGDIKNNFPCRIGLRMQTRFDSMTILDETGAEDLLGKGDMLVKVADSDTCKRFHGPFVRIEDIDAIIHNLDQVRSMMEMMK